MTQYRNVGDDSRERGAAATIGIEDENGAVALQYSFNSPVIESPEFAVLYRPPPSALLHGVVSDANDGLPLQGAKVRILDSSGVEARAITVGSDGSYSAILRLGAYTATASAPNYTTASTEVVLNVADEVVRRDFALATARAEVVPGALDVIMLAGEARTRRIILSNTGGAELVWETRERGGEAIAINSTLNRVQNPAYDPDSRTTEGL